MEAGPVGRAVRAALFAVVSVLLAATGHVLMSEAALPLWILVAGFLGVAVPGWWVAARERGSWFVVGLAVTTQGALHTAFGAAQGLVPSTVTGLAHTAPPVDNPCSADSTESMSAGTEMSSGTADGCTGGMDHAAHVGHMLPTGDMGGVTGMSHVEHMASTGSPMSHDMAGMSSVGMLVAHLLAALVCGIWMARGERAAFQILRSVAGWLMAPLQVPLAAPAPSPQPRTRACRGLSDRLPRGLLCTRDLDPRGPPGGLAAI